MLMVRFTPCLLRVYNNLSQTTVMSNENVGTKQFYLCRCFNTDNIYLEDFNLHVRFVSEQQFRLDYREVR